MYLGHVSGRKVVPDCRRLGSSASDCRLQKGYPLCACQHTDDPRVLKVCPTPTKYTFLNSLSIILTWLLEI